MKQFPDESQMPRSEDGTEPIRGGSIALNRVLNTLVTASHDKRPRFTAVLVNAFTFFVNAFEMDTFFKLENVEEGFVRDLNLFLDYLDTYFAHVLNHNTTQGKYCPVLVYFPDYDNLPKELERVRSGKHVEMMAMYKIFLNRHRHEKGLVKTLDHVRCFFIAAGPASYPHRHLVQSFRDVVARKDTLYVSGDPVGILSHIQLDLYLTYRLRNLHLIERHTGRIRPSTEFHLKLDKEGRVPFQPEVHVVIGDDKLIKPLVKPKVRLQVLNTAGEERWSSRSRADVAARLVKITGIPLSEFRKYDFT